MSTFQMPAEQFLEQVSGSSIYRIQQNSFFASWFRITIVPLSGNWEQ